MGLNTGEKVAIISAVIIGAGVGIYLIVKNSMAKKVATSKANAVAAKKTPPAPKLDSFGNEMGSTVNSNGDYVEHSDPSTLYDAAGNIKANLNPVSGMMEDKNGNLVADAEGNEIQAFDSKTGNYLQDGIVYSGSTGVATGQSANDFVNGDNITFLV